MTESVSVDEILTPEELASCRAYFIAVSNNASNGFTEPPFFRIWLRMVLLTLRRDKSPNATNRDVATQTLAPSTPLSADTVLPPAPTSSLESLGPPQPVPPVATSLLRAPVSEPIGPPAALASNPAPSALVPPPPTEPSALKSKPAPKPPVQAATATPVNVAPASTGPSNVARPLDKTVVSTPSKVSSTSAVKPPTNPPPGHAIPDQSNAKKTTPPVVVRQTTAPAPLQTAKRSSPMPKSATTSKVTNGPSASERRGLTTGSVAINPTLQLTATTANTQTTAQPSHAPPPAILASKTTSAIAHSGARSSHIATPLAVSHPAASPIVVQTPPPKGNAPAAPSRTGQSCNTLPSTPALNANTPQHKAGLAAPSAVAPRVEHRDNLPRSKAPTPSTSQTATAPRKEARIDPPVNIPNKRKRDDTNGEPPILLKLDILGDTQEGPFFVADKSRQLDRSREEGEYSGRRSRNDSNGGSRRSDYGGSREYQWRRNQSDEPRRKRYRRQYKDYRDYGDYYGGYDDYSDYYDGSDDY